MTQQLLNLQRRLALSTLETGTGQSALGYAMLIYSIQTLIPACNQYILPCVHTCRDEPSLGVHGS